MKRILIILLAVVFLTTVFMGCSSKKKEIASIDNGNHGTSHIQGEEQANGIVLSEKITELTDGLSAVRHTGDYGFDEFLEQGGASSDAQVVSFLLESGIGDFGNLLFGGNPFGCSTLAVKDENGNALFGRNFDWNTCHGMIIQNTPENGYASISTVNMDFITVSGFRLSSGCGSNSEDRNRDKSSELKELITENSSGTNLDADSDSDDESESGVAATELTVNFGDDGAPFIMHLYDNDTARAIARHVGTADWRLPIYHYDDYENWEVMQYYDIPSRYEIPSAPEAITEEAVGTVYYSEPNRIVLFYGDAEVTGEYTPVGYFDNTEEFRSAVENNPVLEGWGNKIVLISDGD